MRLSKIQSLINCILNLSIVFKSNLGRISPVMGNLLVQIILISCCGENKNVIAIAERLEMGE